MVCLRLARSVLLGTVSAWVGLMGANFSAWAQVQADQAAAKVAESPPAAVKQYRDAVVLQNRAEYELAEEEWSKFLRDFGQDPLAAKARHYCGICQLQLKKFPEAIANFEQVAAQHPQFDLLDATLTNLGVAHFNRGQAGDAESFDRASAAFATVVERFPQSKQLGQALFYQGEAYYSRGKLNEAIAAYKKLVETLPSHALRADALYGLGVALDESGQAAEAQAVYDKFLQEFVKHEQAAEVTLRRGETLFTSGDFAAAEKWFARSADAAGFALADQAVLRQAAAIAEQKRYAEAAAVYATLVQRFPQSVHVAAATVAAGNCYYLANSYAEAVLWLTKAAALDGTTATEATHWLARAYLKQQRPREALAAVEKGLLNAGGHPLEVSLLLDRADAIFELPDRRGEAAAIYAAIAKDHRDHAQAPQALYLAAFAALQSGDAAAAERYGSVFLKRFERDVLMTEVRALVAESALQLGKPAEAEKSYEELLSSAAEHADAPVWRLRRALAQLLQKKFDAAVQGLEKALPAITVPEQMAEAQHLLGSAELELQHYPAAIKALSAALAAQPKWRQADETWLNLSTAYRHNQQLVEAAEAARRLIAEYPQSRLLSRAHYRLADILSAQAEYVAAAAEYRLALDGKANPQRGAALLGLGWTQFHQQDHAAAVETFGHLLHDHADEPVAARAWYARALAYHGQRQFAAAVSDIQACLKTNPTGNDKSDALYLQGLCLVALDKPGDAASMFAQLLLENPGYPSADKVLYELAWAHKALQHEDEAQHAFERLAREFEASPLAAEAHFRVGERHQAAKGYALASEAFFAAIKKSEKSELQEKAAHKLAWCYYQQERLDDARKQFEYQLSVYPDGILAADAQFMVGECLFRQKQFEASLAAFRRALAKPPEDQEFRLLAGLHAGQAAAQLKLWAEGLKILDQTSQDNPPSSYAAEIAYERAWALQNQDRFDEALPLYGQVAQHAGRELGVRAQFMMGEVQFQKKNYKEAIRNYLKVVGGYSADAPENIQRWQAYAAYEAGLCYENLKSPDKARRLYQEVVERFPSSEQANLAKDRLKNLKG